jgi:hypothetical protein
MSARSGSPKSARALVERALPATGIALAHSADPGAAGVAW